MKKFRLMVIADHRVGLFGASSVLAHMISAREPSSVEVVTFSNTDHTAEDGGIYALDWELSERAAIMGCGLCSTFGDSADIIRYASGGAALFIAPKRADIVGACDLRVRTLWRDVTIHNAKKASKIRVAFVNVVDDM